LFILIVFVMPGFLIVRTKEFLVPTVEKPDALQITLRSVTVSLLYLPLWLAFSPLMLQFRARVVATVQDQATSSGQLSAGPLLDRGLVVFLALSVLLPVLIGGVWAVSSWNDWYHRVASRIYPRLNIPPPVRGIGEDLWDRLWLNRTAQPWLTIFMKDGRVYVGRGVEFSLSRHGRELVLGPDTRLFDKDWNLVRDLSQARGEGVWIPISEVSSIELHE